MSADKSTEILHQDIQTLLEFFSKNCYRASDSKNSEPFYVNIFQNCAINHLARVTKWLKTIIKFLSIQTSYIRFELDQNTNFMIFSKDLRIKKTKKRQTDEINHERWKFIAKS